MGEKKTPMQQSIASAKVYGTSDGKSLNQMHMDTFVQAVNKAADLSQKSAAHLNNPGVTKMAAFETALLDLYQKTYFDDLNRSKKPIITIRDNMTQLLRSIEARQFQSEFTFIMISGVAKNIIKIVEDKRECDAKSQNKPGGGR